VEGSLRLCPLGSGGRGVDGGGPVKESLRLSLWG